MVGAQADSVVAMEKCCLRLDALEETVVSLQERPSGLRGLHFYFEWSDQTSPTRIAVVTT